MTMKSKKQVKKPRSAAPCPTTCSVPYHELPPLSPDKINWIGKETRFKDGRTVGAYRSERDDRPGIFVVITSPISKKKKSELKFRVTDEAAFALWHLLGLELGVIEGEAPNDFDLSTPQGAAPNVSSPHRPFTIEEP